MHCSALPLNRALWALTHPVDGGQGGDPNRPMIDNEWMLQRAKWHMLLMTPAGRNHLRTHVLFLLFCQDAI